jgi:hypothetical protein
MCSSQRKKSCFPRELSNTYWSSSKSRIRWLTWMLLLIRVVTNLWVQCQIELIKVMGQWLFQLLSKKAFSK